MRLSIITVCRNAANTILPTLESVRSQTYADLEHVIVDGASTDETLHLCQEVGHKSMVIVSEPDKGIYDAMNKGIRRATGDYMLFLNAGDSLPSPDTIENVMALCRTEQTRVGAPCMEPAPAIIYGDTDIVDAEGHFLHRRALRPPESLSWRSFKRGMLVCHQAFYVRSDLARETPYDLNYHFSADVDWCIRIMKEAELKGLPIINSRQTLALYLNEGQTTRNHRRSLMERFKVMHRHYGLSVTLLMHFTFLFRNIKRNS